MFISGETESCMKMKRCETHCMHQLDQKATRSKEIYYVTLLGPTWTWGTYVFFDIVEAAAQILVHSFPPYHFHLITQTYIEVVPKCRKEVDCKCTDRFCTFLFLDHSHSWQRSLKGLGTSHTCNCTKSMVWPEFLIKILSLWNIEARVTSLGLLLCKHRGLGEFIHM